MNIFFKEHQEILKALLEQQVEFILIGGYAVNYYGYNRVTGDMDIWIAPNNANKELLLNALTALEFDDEGIEMIRSWDFRQPHKFNIGREGEPNKTEFMTHISGVSYDMANENKIIAAIGNIQLPMINYINLLQNKKASGRSKDLVDIEYLEKIMKLKKGKE